MRAVSLALTPHPETPTDFVRTLEVSVQRGGGLVDLRYVLEGAVDRLRVPPHGLEVRRDELWKHTCFEAFVAPRPQSGYLELNLAPSGDWALYSFECYRHGKASPEAVAPLIHVRRAPQKLVLTATLYLDDALTRYLALAAVIEDENGRLSYWALRHPPGKPDFHHPESFVALP